MMIIGDHKKRTGAYAAVGEFGKNLFCNATVRRSDVVQGNNNKISRRACGRNQWEELSRNYRSNVSRFSTERVPVDKRKAEPVGLFSQRDNRTKFGGGHWHNREARLPDQLKLLKTRIVFNLTKGDRPAQRFNRCKVDGAPIALLCSCVGVSLLRNSGDADYRLFFPAMVEKNFVTLAHFAQVVSRGVVANTRPARLTFRDQIGPRVRGGFLFHQPERFHAER